jgi:hypothetical protein
LQPGPRDRQFASDVDRAGELVGLDSDQTHEPTVLVALETPDDSSDRDVRVGFVADLDMDIDVIAQRVPFAYVEREPIQAGKRVGWNEAALPLNDVALVVVVGRFDQFDEKLLSRSGP